MNLSCALAPALSAACCCSQHHQPARQGRHSTYRGTEGGYIRVEMLRFFSSFNWQRTYKCLVSHLLFTINQNNFSKFDVVKLVQR